MIHRQEQVRVRKALSDDPDITQKISGLCVGQVDDQAVACVSYADLTAKPRTIRGFGSRAFEHVPLHARGRFEFICPGLVNVHVAGCTGATAAALGNNAIDIVLYRAFHDRPTDRNVNCL
jgi:hypothetical protein